MKHQKILLTVFTILSIVGYGAFVFAAPSLGSGGFIPGETLNPDCMPGDTGYDCKVQGGWLLGGNAGTDGGVNNFIGTTDAEDFVIKTNDDETARFGAVLGSVAIGHAVPANAIFPGSFAVTVPTATGLGSFAIGSGSVASGMASFAIGFGSVNAGTTNTASGTASFAIGLTNTVTATNNFAFGEDNIVGGTNGDSYAIGEENIVTSLHGDSYAFGTGNQVSSDEIGFAFGRDNTTSGSSAFAFGRDNTASGNSSIVLGNGAVASGSESTAFQGGIASGALSISGGFLGTEASGTGAMAFGQSNLASGIGSMVLNGENSTSSGFQAASWQQSNTASGKNATAFGSNNTAVGENSVTFGLGNIAEALSEIAIGSYGTDYIPANAAHDEWDTSDRLFTVGNGETDISRSDAFTILKNGKTGIGYDNFETTSSDALLQVNGDILVSSLTSCSTLETDADGLFSCGGGGGSGPFSIVNTSSIFSTGLTDTGLNSSATSSFFVGNDAGNGATSASSSNFLGYSAGYGATNANQSNFLGYGTGYNATNASYSNFFGPNAGYGATSANDSNFLGSQAGYQATSAYGSNFLGNSAGNGATSANQSNFLGYSAGYSATNANTSNFIGNNAGSSATNASNSNFFGSYTGNGATNASNSNFLGFQAGVTATNASYSTFIGANSGRYWSAVGRGTPNAANSIFIGREAAYAVTDTGLDNTTNADDFSILIGNYTSTGGFENSIALGQRAINTAVNQFMIGSSTRPIDETRINGSASTQCTITTGTGIACTSDERVKTNIVDLDNTILDDLLNVRTVTYNWLGNPNGDQQVGFLAQNLEQYFPQLVETDSEGMKSVYYAQMAPVLVEGIKELNLKITNIENFANSENATFLQNLIAWLGDAGNGIGKLFTHEVHTDTLCVGQTCVTENQLQHLLRSQYGYGYGGE